MSLSFMDKVMFVVLKLHLTGNAPLWHSDQADQVAHSQTSHEFQSLVFLPKEEVESTFHNPTLDFPKAFVRFKGQHNRKDVPLPDESRGASDRLESPSYLRPRSQSKIVGKL